MAVVLSGQMQDCIIVDRRGTPLRPAILYSDSRAKSQSEAFESFCHDHSIPLPRNYKGALALPAKLQWLVENAPEDLLATRAILLGAHSYVCMRLLLAEGREQQRKNGGDDEGNDSVHKGCSGEVVKEEKRENDVRRFCFCDATTGSTTGLMDPQGQWAWDRASLDSFFHTHSFNNKYKRGAAETGARKHELNIDVLSLLPHFVSGNTSVGQISLSQLLAGNAAATATTTTTTTTTTVSEGQGEEEAEEQTLSENEKNLIPLYHGAGDTGSATLGAGAGAPGRFYAYLGTSGWIATTRESSHSCLNNDREEGERKDEGERQKREDDGNRDEKANHNRTQKDANSLFRLAHPLTENWEIAAASMMTVCGNVEWFRELMSESRDNNDDLASSPSSSSSSSSLLSMLSYEELDRMAELAGAGAGGVLYAPWLGGERSPFTDSNARACFIGISRSTGKDRRGAGRGMREEKKKKQEENRGKKTIYQKRGNGTKEGRRMRERKQK